MKTTLAIVSLLVVVLVSAYPTTHEGDILDHGKDIILVRKKRQYKVSGDFNTEKLPGGRHDSLAVNLAKTSNKHTLSGGLTYDKTKAFGATNKEVGVNLGYEYKPNKQTSFNVGVGHTKGTFGKSTNLGLGFTHKFQGK